MNLRPRDIMTKAAFENAMVIIMATGPVPQSVWMGVWGSLWVPCLPPHGPLIPCVCVCRRGVMVCGLFGLFWVFSVRVGRSPRHAAVMSFWLHKCRPMPSREGVLGLEYALDCGCKFREVPSKWGGLPPSAGDKNTETCLRMWNAVLPSVDSRTVNPSHIRG